MQKLTSAEYDGMPRSALATGLVDFELLPKEMPERLMAYVETTFAQLAPTEQAQEPKPSQDSEPEPDPGLNSLFSLLSVQTGHDFSQYKLNTLYLVRQTCMYKTFLTDKPILKIFFNG